MLKEIVNEIENFGECFIGTLEVQGVGVFRRFKRVEAEWRKGHVEPLAYNSETGIVWVTK